MSSKDDVVKQTEKVNRLVLKTFDALKLASDTVNTLRTETQTLVNSVAGLDTPTDPKPDPRPTARALNLYIRDQFIKKSTANGYTSQDGQVPGEQPTGNVNDADGMRQWVDLAATKFFVDPNTNVEAYAMLDEAIDKDVAEWWPPKSTQPPDNGGGETDPPDNGGGEDPDNNEQDEVLSLELVRYCMRSQPYNTDRARARKVNEIVPAIVNSRGMEGWGQAFKGAGTAPEAMDLPMGGFGGLNSWFVVDIDCDNKKQNPDAAFYPVRHIALALTTDGQVRKYVDVDMRKTATKDMGPFIPNEGLEWGKDDHATPRDDAGGVKGFAGTNGIPVGYSWHPVPGQFRWGTGDIAAFLVATLGYTNDPEQGIGWYSGADTSQGERRDGGWGCWRKAEKHAKWAIGTSPNITDGQIRKILAEV